jgi:hypothetical protein
LTLSNGFAFACHQHFVVKSSKNDQICAFLVTAWLPIDLPREFLKKNTL